MHFYQVSCCILLFTLVGICCSKPSEKNKIKYKLYDRRGNFSTPSWPSVQKRVYVIRSVDEDGADWRISVALNLTQIQPEEFLVITELDTDEPQEFTYTVRDGQLTELHKFYRNNEYTESYQVIDKPAPFHSRTSRVKIIYLNYNSLSTKVGGISGKYEKYLMHSTCKVSLLEDQSNSTLMCDNKISPYASKCSGEFICPEHFLPLGSAECHSQNWVVCYPDADGLQIITDCVQAYKTEGSWKSCPVDPSYVNYLEMINDGAPKITETESSAGRSFKLNRIKKLCNPSCTAGCSVPTITSGRNKLFQYLFCCKCVAVYKCNFGGTRRSVVFGG